MPELPEVEVTRRSIQTRIEGARIESVWFGLSLRFPLGCAPQRLDGLQIVQAARRGKYLLLVSPEGTLILHLGMSGSLAWNDGEPRGKWIRFALHTDRGVLELDDPRRFGAVMWHEGDGVQTHPRLASLGPEPLEDSFTGKTLFDASRKKKLALKVWLLAGAAVVGVGNIYASETLFLARLSPRMRAGSLSRAQCERLAAAIKTVLTQAVAAGGSTISDFSNALGQAGHFQLQAAVYGREGKPCAVCDAPILRITQAQRSTYFCPLCQRAK